MFTKRHLGFLILAVGAGALVAILVLDWLGMGEFSGTGPFQRLALLVCSLFVILGALLIPFGDRPA